MDADDREELLMKYSKSAMTISELVKETGISRTMWLQAAHHHLAYKYLIKTKGGGKFYIDTEAFEKVRQSVWR